MWCNRWPGRVCEFADHDGMLDFAEFCEFVRGREKGEFSEEEGED